MNLLEGVRIALESLRGHKLRTFLTLLGNIVGTMSVIAVVSLIGGINLFVRQEIAAEGSNVITLSQRNDLEALSDFDKFMASMRNPRLTIADYHHVDERLPARHRVAARAGTATTVAAAGERLEGVNVQGWTASVGAVRNLELASGRLFTRLEVEGSAPVCIIGADLIEELFGEQPATGARVKIGGRHLRVIGALAEKSGMPGESPNRMVMIPLSVFQKLFGPRHSLRIPIRVDRVEETEQVIEEVISAMRLRHRLRPDQPDDFAVMTSEALIEVWQSISRSIFSALIFLVSISLVVGGIVIMNTMLVSVTERTREIGIRKAIGARRRDISSQFLIEAVVLSMVGGLGGIGLGFLIAALVGRFSPLPYAIEAWSIIAGIAVTATVGIFFGLYPAQRAARMPAVEALRYE